MADAPYHITLFNQINLTRRQAGMLCAFAGYTAFAFADVIAKWLTISYHPFQVVSMSYLVGIFLLLLASPWLGGLRSIGSKKTVKIQLWRGLFNFAATAVVVYSLSILPLATAYTMIFASPFFCVLIGVLVYKEHMHRDRMIILMLGFTGIIVAFQPWQESGLDVRLLVPLASSVLIAICFVSARSLTENISLFSLGFTPILSAFLISIPFMVYFYDMPALGDAPLIVLDAVLMCVGVVMVSQAYRLVSADLASPYMYTEMIWALLFGWLVFADTPDLAMMAGAIVIIGCGYYLVKNEK